MSVSSSVRPVRNTFFSQKVKRGFASAGRKHSTYILVEGPRPSAGPTSHHEKYQIFHPQNPKKQMLIDHTLSPIYNPA